METSDYLLHSKLAKFVIENFSLAEKKAKKVCEEGVKKLSEAEKRMQSSFDEIQINSAFKFIEDEREKLLKIFAVLDRIECVIKRNEKRLSFISKEIDTSLSESTDIKKFVENQVDFVDEITLGIENPLEKVLNFDGRLIKVENGKFELNDENISLIKSLSETELKKLFDIFPNILSLIPISEYLDNEFRLKALKIITMFVFDEYKSKSFEEINKNLGLGLNFSVKKIENFESFIDEMINLFKVKIKHYLLEKNAGSDEEIKSSLICNESSIFLPIEHFVQVDKHELEVEKLNEEVDDLLNDILDGDKK